MNRMLHTVAVTFAVLLAVPSLAGAQAIRLGELNSYKQFPAFLEPYKKGMELALDEINAALKPGGLLVMQLPNGDSPFANAVFAADITHETLYTRGSLGHMLAIGGFELLAVDEHSPEPVDFSSGLRWLGWTLMRAGLVLCHRVETGGRSSGAYTRVIRAVARKR